MKRKLLILLAVLVLAAGCDSVLDTNPTASIDASQALQNERGVELAVTGAYSALQSDNIYGQEYNMVPDLYADNLRFTGTFTNHGEFDNRSVFPANVSMLFTWTDLYAGINRVNNVITGIDGVEDISNVARDRYLGEALALRGLFYFNLVRYYGGVPLVLQPSEGVGPESSLARSTQQQVYTQIIEDLTDAIAILPEDGNPYRFSRTGAQALLAKVYLETGEWALARDMATAVIGSGRYGLVSDYQDLFTVKNNPEAIFSVQFTVNDNNSQAFWFFPQDLGGRLGYAPTDGSGSRPDNLVDAYLPQDTRFEPSIGEVDGVYYGRKYFRISNGDDNVYVLRLADMYLTRAEANTRLGADPVTVIHPDINRIKTRAGVPPVDPATISESVLLDVILDERRLEFAMEGHRFFDLRRTGRAMSVLGIPEFRLIFPLPQAELDVNTNLVQNPGY
ncbi:MAG: RagB/SusD family nutrient uptake outer membrane protein [Cyclonatronaceae bacterium]